MSDKLTNVWIHSPNPPPSAIDPWLAECYSGGSHYIVPAATQQAAQDQFLREHPELRGVVRWIFEAPPRPRRPDGAAPADKLLLERDAIPYASLAKRFHPDLCGKRKFDAHMIMSIINELRDATKTGNG
jgi:hypothetical protein